MRSKTGSTGFHARLPWRFDLSGTMTLIRANTVSNVSRQQQVAIILSRPLGRSTLRLWARALSTRDGVLPSRQRSWELEDTYAWRRVVAGGAFRIQQSGTAADRTTAFGRAIVQVRLQAFTLYQNMEYGRDLANRTFFATNRFQTATAGISWRPRGEWSVDAEIFRNRLATHANALQDFVLEGAGIPAPLPLRISGTNQWAAYVRVSRSFGFGPKATRKYLDRSQSDEDFRELTGSIEGFVSESPTDTSSACVPGIAVQMDENRLAYTDQNGRYRFTEVPEGTHQIRLYPRELPAEYDAALPHSLTVVRAGHPTRLDLQVHPLGTIHGELKTDDGQPVGGVTIRLLPSGKSTVTSDEGVFQFHNLRQDTYEVSVDRSTLPPRHRLISEAQSTRTVLASKETHPVLFRSHWEPTSPKRIRVIFSDRSPPTNP